MIQETETKTASGYTALLILFLSQFLSIYALVLSIQSRSIPLIIVFAILILVVFICWFGLYMVQPNEGKVLQLFGEYVGTDRKNGLRWSNPLYSKSGVSLRIRNFESDKLKVNDLNGNPIEIAAVVVWKVVDTAEAMFQVDDYEDFVHIQSESALRGLATRFPYDHDDDDEDDTISLRAHPIEVAAQLEQDIQERLTNAGLEVIEARISHLAYAAEIANAMLQRQQAAAIISARTKIVEGAVGMVEMALDKLSEKEIVELDEERKATMVSNLLVVLTSDRSTQPVVNTGSIY